MMSRRISPSTQQPPPTVTIDGLVPGSTVSNNVPLTITASSSAPHDKIQVWIDDVLVTTVEDDQAILYLWNTKLEFNKTLEVLARSWDENGQSASDSVTVTVSNDGITQFTDHFNTGLKFWRSINKPLVKRGTWTEWTTRTSPDSPPPMSGGKEAYVAPLLGPDNQWHNANDNLRSQRMDASAFTFLTNVQFEYRCRNGFSLWYTIDDGANWVLVDNLPANNNWQQYSRVLDLSGEQFYLELRYTGNVRNNTSNAVGANIDEFKMNEAPSDPPTVDLTSHEDGDSIDTSAIFIATAADDIAVDRVEFFVNGGLAGTDSEAPFEYERTITGEDNRPNIPVSVIAYDSDGLTSAPDIAAINWATPRPLPSV